MYLESFHHRGLKYLSQEDFYSDIFQFNILLRLIIYSTIFIVDNFPQSGNVVYDHLYICLM